MGLNLEALAAARLRKNIQFKVVIKDLNLHPSLIPKQSRRSPISARCNFWKVAMLSNRMQ